MLKKLKSVDGVYLALFALASTVTLVQSLIQGYLLSLNNYAAFIALIAVVAARKIGKDNFKAGIVILLILSTFNITNFFVGQTNVQIDSAASGTLTFNTPKINFIWLFMLVVYCFLKFDQVKLMLNGKQTENIVENEGLINFYYDKFSLCHPDEYKTAIENIEEYPEEAQVALQRLENESVRTLDTAIEADKD